MGAKLVSIICPTFFVILEGSREIKAMQVALKKQSEAEKISLPVSNYIFRGNG